MPEPEQTYECSKCKGMIQTNQVQYEKVSENMSFPTANVSEEGIPKCPHCGYLHFFGFKVIDIAF